MDDHGVQLGIFMDFRNPGPWQRPWPEHYVLQLELITEAERLGCRSVWLTEHHNFADGYLPQPLVMAAAVAARTTTTRIGTAILQAPIRHPAHIAEEAAVVDVLSGGRLELGLGAGYADSDLSLFDLDGSRLGPRTDAVFLAVRELLDHDGVSPGPVQRPFPLWLGYRGPKSARRAGRLGAGLLDINPEVVAEYRRGLTEGGHEASSARVAGTVDIIVADDPDQAWERIKPHYLFQLNSYQHVNGYPALQMTDLGDRQAVGLPPKIAVRLAVLSVEEAVITLSSRLHGLPVRHVYTWATVAGMPGDLASRHLELLFGDVAPRLGTLPADSVFSH